MERRPHSEVGTVREMTSNQIGDLKCMSPTDRFGYGFGIVAGADRTRWLRLVLLLGRFYNTGFWLIQRRSWSASS